MVAAPSRRTRTGVAISANEIVASDLRLPNGHVWRARLDPPESNGGGWPSLTSALAALAEALGGPGRLVVALMPPLTEVRQLQLPPLKPDEVQRLLSRNAARYFLTAQEPQFVGAAVPRRTGRAGAGSVVGATAATRLVNAIYAAAQATGWTVDGVAPAEVGWQEAAVSLWPSLAKGSSNVLVHHADRTDLLQLSDGALAGVRRFRAGASDAELIETALAESRVNGTPPRVGSLGTTEQRVELSRRLSRAAASVSEPPAEWIGSSADPMYVAATFVSVDQPLTLRTESAAEMRAAQGRRLTLRLVAATIALLLVSAGLELWGVKRELAAVNRERAAIRPQLESTIAGRTTLEASGRKLAALFLAQRQSPYLSGVIAAVTDALPQDAYLLSFRARRDTLVLDGLAKHAAAAFDALALVPELANVKSAAGVQRQLQDDGTALEHFTIQAQMLLPAATPTPFVRKKR
ncbi:MAG TPA: hypothetical protein VIV65_03160 [Gemmatimonadaceae bacterium]